MIFPHTIDVESSTVSKDSAGGMIENYSPAMFSVRCFVQQTEGKVVELYKQRRMEVHQTAWIKTIEDYNSIALNDVVKFVDESYIVSGKRNLCNLDRAFGIDLTKVQR